MLIRLSASMSGSRSAGVSPADCAVRSWAAITSITAAEFLARFAADTPWAHLDIAGTAWNLGRSYAEKGSSGFGVRLLVELASNIG